MKKEQGIIILLLVALLSAVAVGIVIDRMNSATEFGVEPEQVDLLITEVCAKNTNILVDSRGKYSDYIEVYNRGSDCNLHGFTLSDGSRSSEPFGNTPMAAGEYRIFFIDKELTGFSVSASGGENIILKNRDGSVAAQVSVSPMGENQVMEWQEMGYTLTERATPGFPNTEEGYRLFTEGIPNGDLPVVISEILTSNRCTLPDRNGVFSDVVELHNRTEGDISLSGWYLSDRKENRHRFALPAVILPAGGYLVIFCDGDAATDMGEIHANFGLSEGETLFLTSSDGKFTSVDVTALPDDRSMLLSDGKYAEGNASPGFANTVDGEAAFAESRTNGDAPLVITEVLLSGDGTPYQGAFCDAVEIYNRSDSAVNTKGYYLSDGDDPYKYALPDTELAPGACVVVICDGGTDAWHAGFALSAGETLRLTCPDYRLGEAVGVISAGKGCSLLLEESEDGSAYRAGEISMGYPNTEQGKQAYLASALPKTLLISEVVTSNKSSLRGAYGTCCDWVELYNASDEPIRLGGWYLSDDPDDPRKGALPEETVNPGEYYIVFLSRDPNNLLKEYAVMPFGLSASGDCLYLTNGGTVTDGVVIPALGTDVSYGRPAGETGFAVLAAVTPHKSNGERAQESAMPAAVTAQGVYNDVPSLPVELTGAGNIYYTTDCTSPTVLSTPYTGPIVLTKTTVIRAMCVENGKKESKVLDLTYIINENHSLPVASLVTEPSNLWDYNSGIYVEGPGASEEFPYVGANFWQTWEKEATVSLYEKDGTGFSSPCGIRIFGAFSRALPMKSFTCFFRGIYGANQLTYPLFGENGLDVYEAFVFRNCGQDFNRARMRDPLLSELAATAMYMPVQKNRPVILYLNGEFWGIYYIREKINENFVAGNCNVSPDDVILDRAVGKTEEYNALINYVKSHSMSDPEAYAYVSSQVDIEQYIDYIILQIYIGNTDNGNIRFFKAGDGKWTWLMYDVDQSSTYVDSNTVKAHLNPAGTGANDWFPTTLINGLLKNSTFKEQFMRRFAWQIENVWNPERVNAAIDEKYALLLPDKERDCEKWNLSLQNWNLSVENLRKFFEQREGYVVEDLKEWFGLSDAEMRSYGFKA